MSKTDYLVELNCFLPRKLTFIYTETKTEIQAILVEARISKRGGIRLIVQGRIGEERAAWSIQCFKRECLKCSNNSDLGTTFDNLFLEGLAHRYPLSSVIPIDVLRAKPRYDFTKDIQTLIEMDKLLKPSAVRLNLNTAIVLKMRQRSVREALLRIPLSFSFGPPPPPPTLCKT